MYAAVEALVDVASGRGRCIGRSRSVGRSIGRGEGRGNGRSSGRGRCRCRSECRGIGRNIDIGSGKRRYRSKCIVENVEVEVVLEGRGSSNGR